MPLRSTAAIALCSIALSQFAAPTAMAAPNGHGNGHAQGNAGDGGGGGGNGNSGGNGNGGGNGNAGGNDGGSVVHQYVVATGAKQGDVASALKSWNSLNANPKAFANNLDNPNSLLGKEAAYICANTVAQTAFADFNAQVPSGTPPTADQLTAAIDYLAAEKRLGTLAPKTVLDDPGSYTQAQIDDATLISMSTLTPQTAQATLDAERAWTDYQTASHSAGSAFATASVSYRGKTDLTKLRAKVDAIVQLKNLDTAKLCTSSTALAQ